MRKNISILSQRKQERNDYECTFHVHRPWSITTAFSHWKWKRTKNAFEVRSWIGYGMWRKIKAMKWNRIETRVLFVFFGLGLTSIRTQANGRHAYSQTLVTPKTCTPFNLLSVGELRTDNKNSLPHIARHRNVSTQSISSEMEKMVNAIAGFASERWKVGFSRSKQRNKIMPILCGPTRDTNTFTQQQNSFVADFFSDAQRIYNSNCAWTYRRLFDPSTKFLSVCLLCFSSYGALDSSVFIELVLGLFSTSELFSHHFYAIDFCFFVVQTHRWRFLCSNFPFHKRKWFPHRHNYLEFIFLTLFTQQKKIENHLRFRMESQKNVNSMWLIYVVSFDVGSGNQNEREYRHKNWKNDWKCVRH